MIETGKAQMLRAIFDVLPSMLFVVDDDVRIQEYNRAAGDLLKVERGTILRQRAGEILHCVHSTEAPEGCGRAAFCKKCVVRNSVAEAFHGNRVVRKRMKLELEREGENKVIYALVTASPFLYQERPHALLVLEDITEIAELQRLIPICSVCRKVRDDQDAWMQLESYFKESWDVDFTHGFCPDCMKKEMEKIDRIKQQ
jgi:PAS domain-containing protein